MDTSIIICSCYSTEHQMVFLPFNENIYDHEDQTKIVGNYKELYVHVHLNKLPFWSRIKYAIKYIFGYQCRYGAFDEFIIDKSNVHKLKEAIKFIEE